MWCGSLAVVCLLVLGLSEARKGFGPGEQDWGYVDVREGAHMFYWLFYTTANVSSYTERPLVLWLQGGPGGSLPFCSCLQFRTRVHLHPDFLLSICMRGRNWARHCSNNLFGMWVLCWRPLYHARHLCSRNVYLLFVSSKNSNQYSKNIKFSDLS